MKRIASYILSLLAVVSCSDWSDHYDEALMTSSTVDIYQGDIVSYMKSTADVSAFSAMLDEAGVYDSIYADKQYTFVVCDNSVYGSGAAVTDKRRLAQYSVSDMAIEPSKLTDGFGIHTRSGKNIWVYGSGSSVRLDDYSIVKTVKTHNGYIYYINGVLPIRLSAYEYLQQLGDDYSTFKQLVAKNEEIVFDREHSRPIGVNNEGMTVYDSVKVIRNELMDRYTRDGIATWNMRDESYVTTMFIPTNDQIAQAISTALDSVQLWHAVTDEYGRTIGTFDEATQARYREKFENWIVRACFADRRLSDSQVSAGAPDFTCVGDYQMIVDRQADKTRYSAIEPAYWRPSVQTVDLARKVALSNGTAYYCTNLKIPTHVIIYRLKARFFQLWNTLDENPDLQAKYFRWNHWTGVMVIPNCQGEFMLSETLPTMYYHELTAIPDEEAIADSLPCSVEYDGLQYVAEYNGPQETERNGYVVECNLPAGEYYLRMGFKHSLQYSLSIWFNDSLVVKDMIMYAQGSNFHFDRGAAAPLPHYGELGISYPEGFDPDYWMEQDQKAIAYDTDGYTVAIVRQKHSGNFRIKVESSDMSRIFDPTATRNKNNVKQLMMYHWCLRPTKNNY